MGAMLFFVGVALVWLGGFTLGMVYERWSHGRSHPSCVANQRMTTHWERERAS